MARSRWLTAGWTVSGTGYVDVPATVPGCVHTDLLAAGLIPDPLLDDHEQAVEWVGEQDWLYTNRFDAEAGPVDLVCEGLDTVATVTVNGVLVGRAANMHRSYRFPVTLVDGENTLSVAFESPLVYARRWEAELGARPGAYADPYPFIRKMACNFGWDWGPRLVTAGIWRPIGLHAWSTARLADVRPLVTVDSGLGVVELHVTLARAGDEPVVLRASVAGVVEERTVLRGQSTAVLRLRVRDPALWFPRGYGAQPRHDLQLGLTTVDGTELDSWHRRIGFRTVELDTTPDEHGSPFTLVVNGRPVFVRGVNWIPNDPFPHRVDRQRYATRLGQAVDAGVNLARVWGGGRYESDDFYELCDELGLLVQQDFLFACAAYPEEEPFATEVAAEAAEQVTRLAPYPSLVLWCGNNENQWGYADWGWALGLDGRTWGAGYYGDVLPRIVASLDPTRPYWPGTPTSGISGAHPNDPSHGTTHLWDVWNRDDYTHYRDYTPRFVAEFGYQGPPTYATLRRAGRHHQKAEDGDAKLASGLAAHLPTPRDADDWLYLAQVNQARAIALGVTHFRASRPVCMGTVIWQLNDCWPVTSWSLVDGDGRRKPLWYAVRRAYADRLLTIQPTADGLDLVAVNDTDDVWTPRAEITRTTLTGDTRAQSTVEFRAAPRTAVRKRIPAELSTPDDPTRELLTVDSTPEWFFAEDKDIPYPPAEYDAVVTPAGAVTVTARTILRDLALFPDRLDPAAEVDEQLVTLLPGQAYTFTVTGVLDPVLLTTRPVLRCVNDI